MGVLEVGADRVEFVAELAEVALEPVQVAEGFLGPLLDLESAQAKDDRLQVG